MLFDFIAALLHLFKSIVKQFIEPIMQITEIFIQGAGHRKKLSLGK